jgi:hypothetical protein
VCPSECRAINPFEKSCRASGVSVNGVILENSTELMRRTLAGIAQAAAPSTTFGGPPPPLRSRFAVEEPHTAAIFS